MNLSYKSQEAEAIGLEQESVTASPTSWPVTPAIRARSIVDAITNAHDLRGRGGVETSGPYALTYALPESDALLRRALTAAQTRQELARRAPHRGNRYGAPPVFANMGAKEPNTANDCFAGIGQDSLSPSSQGQLSTLTVASARCSIVSTSNSHPTPTVPSGSATVPFSNGISPNLLDSMSSLSITMSS